MALLPAHCRPACCILAALIGPASACAPSFEQLVGEPSVFQQDDPERRSPREQELNRLALLELMARADQQAQAEPHDPMPVLPVVVARPPSPITPDGVLTQAGLADLLQAGPHAILGLTDWAPARQQDRALGLVLGTPNYGDEIIQQLGLRTGDIIRQVNGESVLLPDAFMRAWDALASADQIEIVYLRDGVSFTLTLPVEPPTHAHGAEAVGRQR